MSRSRISVALLVTCLGAARAFAARPAKSWVDPVRATAEDADFALQGEYVCGPEAIQVVALGNGRFYVARYAGGLPGKGWDGNTPKGAVLDRVAAKRLVSAGSFRRVMRASPTLGKCPPAKAVVLFDSSRAKQSLVNWKNARLIDRSLLAEGASTSRHFGSFKLHLEFRVPYEPDAGPEGRGNSGIYIHNRYEVQIIDSFGLQFFHIGRDDKGSKEWRGVFEDHLGFAPKLDRSQLAGCLYKQRMPSLNMCYPPLSWQTYDITFTAARFEGGSKIANARITVLHNGVMIHDDVELPKGTGAGGRRREVPREGIYLQAHGSPVRFRNIWIMEMDN